MKLCDYFYTNTHPYNEVNIELLRNSYKEQSDAEEDEKELRFFLSTPRLHFDTESHKAITFTLFILLLRVNPFATNSQPTGSRRHLDEERVHTHL